MPLDAEAETVGRRLDALDHPVRRKGVDHHAVARVLGGLMVGAVHLHLVAAADAVQQGAGLDADRMARLIARIGLLMFERPRHLVGNVLDQPPAEDDMEQLLAAADPEHRQIAGQRGPGQRQLEGGAALLRGDAGVA